MIQRCNLIMLFLPPQEDGTASGEGLLGQFSAAAFELDDLSLHRCVSTLEAPRVFFFSNNIILINNYRSGCYFYKIAKLVSDYRQMNSRQHMWQAKITV